MPDIPAPASVADALARRAARTPDRLAYVFLGDGEEEQARFTYAGLDARARSIAAALHRSVGPGQRALLLDPPGLDFVAAFFGCLYAGVIAVPAYPPRSPRKMPRLLAILADARPAVVLAAGTSLRRMRGWLERTPEAPEAATLSWLASDELDAADGWVPPMPGGDAVAFLQYTSGSTSTPKGVRVTQRNLAHNQRVIQGACGHSEESVFVSWLPVYHDLGLIGNLLQATWVGAPCVLMAPVAFLQSPARWLRAISNFRGTTSGGPNFAYDLCARRVSAAEIEQLDLSSWRVAFNGAEPVREETLSRFAATFASAGFEPGALYPCYGLAEATLMVSGGRPGEESVVREVDGRRLVGCGHVLADLEVAIVDPDTGVPCAPGGVGEIWVAGGSVADGYWNRPAETTETFGATLADGRGPWLRTGDLGALETGELFVAGRLKDLIILRGRNHYPQDLEATAGQAHPALADGTCAGFAIDASLDGSVTEERLVIVHEVERHADRLDEIAASIRQAIAEEHEALVYEVVLVPPGGVPRTTSGKVQRRACRDLYLRGELRALGASRLSPATAMEDPALEAVPGSLDWLARAFAAAARVDPARVDPDRPLSASGLDSLAAVELAHAVEEATEVSLSFPDLLEGMTLRELARQVAAGTATAGEAVVILTGETAGEHPLSWNQRSLWFLHRLAPESPAYNIAGAARLQGTSTAALARALQGLVERHPMLRATFADTADGPVQRVAERAKTEDAAFEVVEAAGWSDEQVRARLQAEAFRPFDLTAGPLLRATLVQRGDDAFFALAVHHIAADFWSMAVLARELGALAAGEVPPPPAARYTDFARRQQDVLQSPAGERLWEHWRERLAGASPLDLPTDRPRRPMPTLHGGSRSLPPSPERAEAVRRLAAEHGGTPFVALLAAWQAVLSRWSGQEEFLLGSPMAGRSSREWAEVVGYFVNLVPLRSDLSGDPPVRELVTRTRRTTLDALAHQDFPFALLTERLEPERDLSRPPLVAAMLTFEKAPTPELAGLAAFAVGVPGTRLDLGGLILESLPLDPPAAQLDLSLMAAELTEGLALSLQWDADLFDETTAGRMMEHLDRVLAGMAAAPGRRVGEIDLLTPAEQAQLADLTAVAGSATDYPREATIPQLFEEQAARTPERIALAAGDGLFLTYADLNARANRLAYHLNALGVAPETPVGVALERSPDLLAALLGILKAGGIYVPLDPGYPPERLARMREEVELPFLVTEDLLARDREAIAARSAANPDLNLDARSDAASLAYVMFTSGSTGRPKAVGIPHRAVVRLVRNTNFADLGPDQAFLHLAPASFDAATLEIWAPLLNGGRLALFPPGPAAPAALGAEIVRQGITTLWLTAGLFHEAVDSGVAGLSPLRQLLAGGDTLSPEHVNRVLAELPGCAVINGYGPTENTTFTCCHTVREPVPPGGTVPIGRAVAHTRVELLDARFQRVPPGVPGELFAGGDGLARGYLGRPDLTAERFVPNPFAAGDRLYRTGDRVRLNSDGAIEFLGRLDRQVKIRGFRVEPGEVEAAVAERPGIAAAAVLVLGAGSGKRLVAFVLPAEPEGESPERLRERLRDELRQRLPSFMVPSRFVVLDALPWSPNGKVDRHALEALLPTLPDDSGEHDFEPPRGSVEEILAGIWADLLGRDRISRGDDFFALGGHSLLAMRLIARMRETFDVELPLARIFGRTTLAEMAIELKRARGTEAAGELPPLVPGPRPAEIPLSFAQERLWFLDRLAPGQAVYNVPVALRLCGSLDLEALQTALNGLLERHEALRTVFAEGTAGPVQVILPAGPFALDLSGTGSPEEEARRPFDLATGPLVRGRLLRLGPEDHLLVLTIHHIAVDGGSLGVLFRDLEALYLPPGEPSPLLPLAVQYADYALWQRGWMTDEVLERRISWWRTALAGAPEALDLPADRPRAATPSWRGTALHFALPAPLVDRLRTIARRQDATLFMVVLAGFSALLSRWSGQTDLVLGTVMANRDRAELEGLIGFFVNALPLRLRLDGDPGLRTLLGRAREAALSAFAHGDVPFERLVEALAPRRDRSRSPLFQVSLAFQETPARPPRFPGVAASFEPLHTATSRFDLNLLLEEADGGLAGGAEANADLFEAITVERLLGHLATLLGAAAAEPDRPLEDLPLLSGQERHQLTVLSNLPAHEVPAGAAGETLHRSFARTAARTPDAVAVICGERQLSYAALDRAANRLARRLRRLGLGPEARVALLLDRSPELIVGVLGILKAGGAYVPIDPDVPGERLAYVLADARPRAIVTQANLAARLDRADGAPAIVLLEDPEIDAEDGPIPEDLSEPGHAAYVIYTSGSTGRPKGVVVEHRQAARLLPATEAWFGFGSGDVWTLFHSIAFDFSVWEIWGALTRGGRLVVVPYWTGRSPEEFYELLAAEGVTVLSQTPSVFRQIVRAEAERAAPLPLALRHVIFGGEALEPVSLGPWFDRHGDERPRLANLYGITETTVHVTFRPLSRADLEAPPASSPLGRAIPDLQVYLLDRRGEPVPTLVPGEIHVGGAGVARGYLERPGLTAERFVPDPFSGRAGGRLYRSGDLARRRQDGEIEYLGRTDHQVKVRGFRIEPGEIEAALIAHGQVAEAAVGIRGAGEEARLVAWVAPVGAGAEELRRHLKERLPDYMIPAAFVFLDALPLTQNGKLDRRALPEPAGDGGCSATGFAAPRTPTEELIAEIWAGLLDRGRVGRDDDFFALGGHSLLATRVMSRLRVACGVELPLREIFEASTLSDFAARVESARQAGTGRLTPPLVPVPREGPVPLSFAQQRLWLIDQLDPGRPLYNIPLALRVAGPLHPEALARSLAEIVRRHEALRTVFASVAGSSVQVIQPAAPLGLPLIDLSGLRGGFDPSDRSDQTDRSDVVTRLIREEAGRPFDLRTGPLVRLGLLRLAAEDHTLLLTLHHIVGDGWSIGILVRELTILYPALTEGRPPALPEPPFQYADFSEWQRSWLHGEALDGEVAFWRDRLAELPPRLDLPTDRQRPAVPSFRGAAVPVRLPVDQVRRLQLLSRREGATLFMVLLAGFQTLLARWSGQRDFAIGTPVAGRNQVEIEGVIGFFVNTLVLRGDLTGESSFRELLGRTRETTLAAHAHQDVPFERLVQELSPERSLAHTPLFQVMLALQNLPGGSLKMGGLVLSPVDADTGTAKFDLSLSLEEQDGELVGALRYASDLFDRTTLLRLVDHLERLLAAAADAPERPLTDLKILSAAQHLQLLTEWNDTAPYAPALPVHRLFALRAERMPTALAVRTDAASVTYGELAARVRSLAGPLRALGAGPEQVVAVCLERSADLVAALLAVLTSGAAYLPLDPRDPQERRAQILKDAKPLLLLTRKALAAGSAAVRTVYVEDLPEAREGAAPAADGPANALAYVLYTSGSTGRPKGVMVNHRNLSAYLGWIAGVLEGAGVRWLPLLSSVTFDASLKQLFVPLLRGEAVRVASEDALLKPARLLEILAEAPGAGCNTVPALWEGLLDALERGEAPPPPSLCALFLGGERLPEELVARTRRLLPDVAIHNLYGPTEATANAAWARLDEATGKVVLGRPVGGAHVVVADSRLRPVPLGAVGELCVGGTGVARGYLGDPRRTAERFVPDPYGRDSGGRLYRTGDLARWLPEGALAFLGRLDQQVKIRGFRIEPGEIETLLMEHPGVRSAVVLAPADAFQGQRLVAFVEPHGLLTPDPGDLRSHLERKLPSYMMPSVFQVLGELPRTKSGKIDRTALAALALEAEERQGGAEPQTPLEKVLAGMMAEALGLHKVGLHDNFFELGGHSMRVIALLASLREAFGIDLPLFYVFDAPTAAGLAGVLLESPEWRQTAEELAPALLQLIEPPAESEGVSLLRETR